MAGVVMALLTEKELRQIQGWYVSHLLAEENSLADDALVEKLRGYSDAVACRVPGKDCAVPRQA